MSTDTPDVPTIETSPKRPYLLRAFYEWIVDNGLTPHVLVNALQDNVQVPQSYVKDGSIVLNISPGAVHDWFMDNDAISFSARFSGSAFPIYLPMRAIMAIYANENQDGLSFHDTEYATVDGSEASAVSTEKRGMTAVEAIASVDGDDGAADQAEAAEGDKPAKKPRPDFLRVVK